MLLRVIRLTHLGLLGFAFLLLPVFGGGVCRIRVFGWFKVSTERPWPRAGY
jgi:hypothetical protein